MLLCLLCMGCNKQNGIMFEGDISGAEGKFLTVSLMTPDGETASDSVQIKNGYFQLTFPMNDENPHFFRISLRNDNAFTTLATKGEKLSLVADAASLVRNYSISGGTDAELMQKLDRQLSLFVDSTEILMEWYNLNTNDDTLREQIERAYNQITANHTTFLRQFIQENPQSLSSLAAFYQRYNQCIFLPEEENLDLLKMLYDSLQKQYPDSEDVMWVGERLKEKAQQD